MRGPKSNQVSSFTIIKGALIDETYRAFETWDFVESMPRNLASFKATNPIGAQSANWLRDVAFVLSRRFDPFGRDRPLVELAKGGCEREIWVPILLWHMTRNEFLVRDFLINWLYPAHARGVYQITADELIPYLKALPQKGGTSKARWSDTTLARVSAGLLRIGVDFGLLAGRQRRRFAHYHLPDESFGYLLHAMASEEHNAHRIVHSTDWRMYLMAPSDVERELLRLHQYQKLSYEVAGSLAQLQLPCESAAQYARGLVT
mgnify:CR=1 FL=1